jgi:general secretion pathway protein A
MYEAYYELRERPFDLSPNPRFLFLSKGHREALVHLRYGLSGRPGLTVLIGEAGTGKTTLIRAALQSIGGGGSTVVHLSNPTLTRSEFYEYLAAAFSLGPAAASSKTAFLRELQHALIRQSNGAVLALVADEAQSLPHTLLEEIRLLTNLEGPTGGAVAVALVGQPELAARLADPRLRQLKQRVALRCELRQLELAETAAYIAARVRVAGGNPEMLFTRDAVAVIHQYARGLPRTISVICDNALVSGFALDAKPVGRSIVLEVCRDFDLGHVPAADPAESRQAAGQDVTAGQGPKENPPSGADGLFGSFARRRFSFF